MSRSPWLLAAQEEKVGKEEKADKAEILIASRC
jgi:hypothetical protein